MCEVQEYLKSLNPSKEHQGILFYGSTYKLWRDGQYLGQAIWTKDENVGDSFQIEKSNGIQEVFIADKWELVNNQNN